MAFRSTLKLATKKMYHSTIIKYLKVVYKRESKPLEIMKKYNYVAGDWLGFIEKICQILNSIRKIGDFVIFAIMG